MNRREFLTTLAAVPLAAAVLPVASKPVMTGWATTGLKAGDVFTISGVYVTNPHGSERLQEFTAVELR